jgi:hypothetical protein
MPGVTGVGLSSTSGLLAWVTADGLPILHAVSVLATIFASVATGIYYIAKWRQSRKDK